MPPSHDEGKGGGGGGGAVKKGPERVPLLGGLAIVQGNETKVAYTNSMTNSGAFTGEGYTLMSHGAVKGLLNEADDAEESRSCYGWEFWIYRVLARLPFLHTFVIMSVWLYLGREWLLLRRPDVAVGMVSAMMIYGMFRFWLMWGSCFHAMNMIRKNDSRDPTYWQKQPRPPGPDFHSVWHAVMVPNYKEPIEKLRQTLDTIVMQSVANQIVVCMAMESRDPHAVATASALQREYGELLGGFCYALHPLAEGEVAGKSSNENWAARCIKKVMVDDLRINPDSITITTCDADTYFHPNHFAYLSHAFLTDGADRYHRFYIPVTNFMPNVAAVPGICSTRYTALSIGRMAELGNPLGTPFPLAIYSLSLKLAMQAAYWDPTVIPEDWHMYFRCVFADKGKVQVTRMMITVGTEAVEGRDYLDTIKECYKQSVRWQWGAIDIGYLIVQLFERVDTPFLRRLQILHCAYDHHLFVVVMCLGLFTAPFLYGRIPVALDLDPLTGRQTELALKDVMLCTWAVHSLCHCAFLAYTDVEVRRSLLKNRQHFELGGGAMSFPLRQLALLLFPIADFALFVIPTLHAHIRMFFSSDFTYVPSAKLGSKFVKPDCCGGRADDSTV